MGLFGEWEGHRCRRRVAVQTSHDEETDPGTVVLGMVGTVVPGIVGIVGIAALACGGGSWACPWSRGRGRERNRGRRQVRVGRAKLGQGSRCLVLRS